MNFKWLEKLFGIHLRAYRKSFPKGFDINLEIIRLAEYYDIPIETVFDIGANIGITACELNDLFPKALIYAFEPVPDTFIKLKKRTFSRTSIKCFETALGNEICSKMIDIGTRSDLVSFVESTNSGNEIKIKVDTLDQITQVKNIKRIDFLKIDTEGFDLEVLKGAEKLLMKQRIEFIQVETKLGGPAKRFVPLQKFNEFLNPLGYDLMGCFEQEGWHLFSPLYYCNALFMKRRNWDE